jgi:hypothetical protein
MSSRQPSSVREVLESIATTVKTTVDDLSGETDRLRNQIVVNKQAMLATVTRAEGVTPIMPAYEVLKVAYVKAKSDFEKLEHGADPRPALAAQALLRTAAENLAAVRTAHDLQHTAMTACATWQGVHGAALKVALAATGLAPSVVTPHAELVEANNAFLASLRKPDFIEADGLHAAVGLKLDAFVKAQTAAQKPAPQKMIGDAVTTGNLAARLKEPDFLKEVDDWVKTADATDPAQRANMIAVIKGLDPAEGAMRKKVFELAFKTKMQSQTRLYSPIMVGKPPKPKLDSKGQPMMRDEFKDNVPLDAAAMDAMADVMGQLPARHMPSKWFVLGQNADENTRGSYDDKSDGADLAFSLKDSAKGFKQEYAGNCAPGDPLEKAKAFDVMIRHECGHKAGAVVGCDALTGTAMAGEWIHHNTAANVLTALASVFQDFVAAVQVTGAPTEVAIRKAVLDPENGFDPGAIAAALGIDEARVPAGHLLFQVLHQGAHKKFLCGTSPVSVGGRMYVVGGPEEGSWFSFSKAAWDKRVSLYQYAAPMEWFAEFYATANNGDAKVRQEAKSRFPLAWDWLKDHDCIVVGV